MNNTVWEQADGFSSSYYYYYYSVIIWQHSFALLILFIAAVAATAAIVAIAVVIAEKVRLQLGQVLLSAQPAGKVKNDAALERERKVERKREIIR